MPCDIAICSMQARHWVSAKGRSSDDTGGRGFQNCAESETEAVYRSGWAKATVSLLFAEGLGGDNTNTL